VLIDGPYIEAQNDGKGLRGSSNQSIHHLTNRLSDFDFANSTRTLEMFFRETDTLTVGVLPLGFGKLIGEMVSKIGGWNEQP
jgi:anaerobic ribonucleoside-triphosphate reductase activating protein